MKTLNLFYFFSVILFISNIQKIDAQTTFSDEQIISGNANGATDVYAADLDNDGDTDVLYSAQWNNQLAWFENDGNGNFTDVQTIYNIYPNPAHTHFWINSDRQETINYEIFNTLGESLQQGTSATNTNIDIANLPKGVYFIALQKDNNNTVLRLLK